MKRVDVDVQTKLLIVKFAFRRDNEKEFKETLEKVMSLSGKIYSKSMKAWIVPPEYHNIQNLWDWGFSFPPDWAATAGGRSVIRKVEQEPYLDIKLPRYLHFLRPYQKEAVQFLAWRKGRGLIGDDMGVGKTIEALGWIRWTVKRGPALIVVPTSTKLQWEREYNTYVDDYVEVLYGKKGHELDPLKSYIINWEILQYWESFLRPVRFYTIVTDECQYMGSMKAEMTKTARRLARGIRCYIPMSGTPINSKPRQFYPILNLLSPMEFNSEWKFLHRYCGPKHNGFSMTYDGISHEDELYQKISNLMIRRNKRDVLKDLPPVEKIIVPMDLGSNKKAYKALEEDFLDSYKPKVNLEFDEDLYSFKLEIFDLKFNSITKWIDEFLKSDKKIILGVWHHYVTGKLYNKYKKKAVVIDGSVTGAKREKALNQFYGDKQILFLQMKSGGVGLDGLQKVCTDLAFIELPNTPTILDQFISRLDRSGKIGPTDAYLLLGNGTLEMELLEAMDEVRQNIEAAVDGRRTKESDLLSKLLKRRLQDG